MHKEKGNVMKYKVVGLVKLSNFYVYLSSSLFILKISNFLSDPLILGFIGLIFQIYS